MIYRIFAVLTVAAVIVGSLLLARQENTPQVATIQRADTGDGYSARDAQLVETGANGLPLYIVNAASIHQLPHKDQVQLTEVGLSFHDPSGNLWSATADRGAIVRGSGNVNLSGHVHVTGALPKAQAPIQISTRALTYHTHTDRVSTADPVKLVWAQQTLDATGLTVNLKTHRLHLKSKVHAVVTPSH